MKNIFLYLTILIAASACTTTQRLVPFTATVQRDTGLSNEQLKKVQFYTSSRIVLYREIGKNRTEVVSGEIKIIDGKEVEQIVIRENTPGIVVSNTTGNRLAISFEAGKDRAIIFGSVKQRRGAYTILARDWEGNSAIIDYDGKAYKLAPQSSNAILLVNLKKLNAHKVNNRTAAGRTL